MSITEFLLARIAEDEAVALEAASETEPHWLLDEPDQRIEGRDSREIIVYDEGSPQEYEAVHIARHDPARILAECKAKRRAIDAAWSDHEQIESEWGSGQNQETMDAKNDVPEVVRALASVYADHPNYDPAWA